MERMIVLKKDRNRTKTVSMSTRIFSFVMSLLMVLTTIPDMGSGIRVMANAAESTATPTDAEGKTGKARISVADADGNEYADARESALDFARVVYKVYTDEACTDETGTEFVLSFNGRSYVDKTGELVLYEEQSGLEEGTTSGDEEFTAELPVGTYYVKQADSLWNDDGKLADVTVPEIAKNSDVKSFSISEDKTTIVKPVVKQTEEAGEEAAIESAVATSTDAGADTKSVDEQINLLESAKVFAVDATVRKVSAVSTGGTVYIGGSWTRWGSSYAGSYHVSSKKSTAEDSGGWTGRDAYEDTKGPNGGNADSIECMRVFCGAAGANGFKGSAAAYTVRWASGKDTAKVLAWGNAMWDTDWSGLDYREKIYRIHEAVNSINVNGGSGTYYEAAIKWAEDNVTDDASAKIYVGKIKNKASSRSFKKTYAVEKGTAVGKGDYGSGITFKNDIYRTGFQEIKGAVSGQYVELDLPKYVGVAVYHNKTWRKVAANTQNVKLYVGDVIFFYATQSNVSKHLNGKTSTVSKAEAHYAGVRALAFDPPAGSGLQTMYAGALTDKYSISFTVKWSATTSTDVRKKSSDNSMDLTDNCNYSMAGIVYEVQNKDGSQANGMNGNHMDDPYIILSWDGRAYASSSGYPIILYSQDDYDNYYGSGSPHYQTVSKLTDGKTYYLKEKSRLYHLHTDNGAVKICDGSCDTFDRITAYKKYKNPNEEVRTFNGVFSSSGYELNENRISFVAAGGEVVAKDEPKTFELSINKVLSDSIPKDLKLSAAGARFTVYYTGDRNGEACDYDDGEEAAVFKINDEGKGEVISVRKVVADTVEFTAGGKNKTTLTGLPAGNYTIVETSVPAGLAAVEPITVYYGFTYNYKAWTSENDTAKLESSFVSGETSAASWKDDWTVSFGDQSESKYTLSFKAADGQAPVYGSFAMYKESVSSNGKKAAAAGAVYDMYSDSGKKVATFKTKTGTAGEYNNLARVTYINSTDFPSVSALDVYEPDREANGYTAAADGSEVSYGLWSGNNPNRAFLVGLPVGIYYVYETSAATGCYNDNSRTSGHVAKVTVDTAGETVEYSYYDSVSGTWKTGSAADNTKLLTRNHGGTYRPEDKKDGIANILANTSKYNNIILYGLNGNTIVPVYKATDRELPNEMILTKKLSSDNQLVSVEGAEYTVYYVGSASDTVNEKNFSKSYKVAKFTVDKDGNGIVSGLTKVSAGTVKFTPESGKDSSGKVTVLSNLPAGIYAIEETKVPSGLDKSSTMFVNYGTRKARTWEDGSKVTYGKGSDTTKVYSKATVSAVDNVTKDPVGIVINKVDADTGETITAEGDGAPSLAGAIFKIEYFHGMTSSQITGDTGVTNTWYVQTKWNETNKQYEAWFDLEHLVSNDTYNSDEAPETISETSGLYKLEPGAFRITEVAAPEGYLNIDSTNGGYIEIGGDVSGNKESVNSVKFDLDIYGNFIAVNAGVEIDSDQINYYDQVQRSDIYLKKTEVRDSGALESMKDIVFEIKSESTGEIHYVVTDENGEYDSSKVKHSENTNGNDALFTANAALDSSYGLWFTGEKSGDLTGLTVNDDKGALPYGTYTITELRYSSNKGYILASVQTVTISEDGQKAEVKEGSGDYRDFENFKYPEVKTLSDDYVLTGHEMSITDTVNLKYLYADKVYTIKGIIMDKTTGKAAVDGDGNYITAEKTFTAHIADGDTSAAASKGYVIYETEEMQFTMNTIGMDSDYTNSFVVFEYLYEGESEGAVTVGEDGMPVTDGVMKNDSEELICHADINDDTKEQTFKVVQPLADTVLTTTDKGLHTIADYETADVTDVVTYSNLVPGRKYTLVSKLVDGASGEVISADGSEFVQTQTFTADSGTGTVGAAFTLDMPAILAEHEGLRTIVAYQYIYEGSVSDDNFIVKHEDLTDTDQTLSIVSVHTTAKDTAGGNVISTDGLSHITDTVSYTGLIPGTEYTISGTLMCKETEKPVTDDNGKEITGSATFTPSAADGKVKVEFEFDAETCKVLGKRLVVFEDVLNVYIHADIDDEDQTVYVPDVSTTLSETDTGAKKIKDVTDVRLSDTVVIRNLPKGTRARLTSKLVDKTTGRVITATKQKSFTASGDTDKNGITVDTVVVDFPSFNAKGKEVVSADGTYHDVVAYEYLEVKSSSGWLAKARHEDINDADQTVTFEIPTGSTRAEDKASGTQTAYPGTKVTIVDHVSYKNLVAGREYTVTGTVMRKDTGKALGVSGSTKTVKFIPEESDGTVDVEFTFDASALAGEQIVIFENCYMDKTEVFVHEDLEDEDQTITFPNVGTMAAVGGGKYLEKGADNTIIDTIAYEGFDTEETYIIRAELIDKSTEKVVTTSKSSFTPESSERFADGTTTISLEFYVPDSGSGSKKYVIYERIYTQNGALICEHADLNNENQTVMALYSPKTGDTFSFTLTVLTFGLTALATVLSTVKRRRKKEDM